MTRDQILYVAQNHWLYDLANPNEELAGWLVEFARVIAAAERDAIYKIAAENCNDDPPRFIDQTYMRGQYEMATYIAARIKARGQS